MKNKMLRIAFTVCIASLMFSFDLPKSWYAAGSNPGNYDMGVDKADGKNTATIKSKHKKVKKGFGTLMQHCAVGKFLGKRVRMSGRMKTSNVSQWAGFWLRVDATSGAALAFDNMHDGKSNRAVTGTTDWTRYEIVLNVPAQASSLAYGALLSGGGQIWFDDISFEIVDMTVPTTGDDWNQDYSNPSPDQPQNLDFEQ